jgi:ATP-dependent DNA helicase RecG
MYVENANRAVSGNSITPDNLAPESKNPSIAAFFRNIWLADELGSGVRRLYHYVPRYSGKNPELIDGDIFRIIVPLDDDYSYEVGKNKAQSKGNDCTLSCTLDCTLTQIAILEFLAENPSATQVEVASITGKSVRTVKSDMAVLREKGLINREGGKKNGTWVVIDKPN